jgi:SAM-dependent methyltransferase
MKEVLGLTGFQWIILIFLTLGVMNYLFLVFDTPYENKISGLSEGFQSGAQSEQSESEKSSIAWFENDELFDDFYASVYDNLTQLSSRFPQEVALIVNQWKKKTSLDTMDVLDCGCGSGIASILFAKIGVNSVVGLDKSDSMLRRAKSVTIPSSGLSLEKRESVTFLKGDMNQQHTFSGGKFSHAALLFFTVYYSNDMSGLFRNLFHWIRPGGQLAIELVNKYKFDPLLE